MAVRLLREQLYGSGSARSVQPAVLPVRHRGSAARRVASLRVDCFIPRHCRRGWPTGSGLRPSPTWASATIRRRWGHVADRQLAIPPDASCARLGSALALSGVSTCLVAGVRRASASFVAPSFVAGLAGLATAVVFSAAVPGQRIHHVNEQCPGTEPCSPAMIMASNPSRPELEEPRRGRVLPAQPLSRRRSPRPPGLDCLNRCAAQE